MRAKYDGAFPGQQTHGAHSVAGVKYSTLYPSACGRDCKPPVYGATFDLNGLPIRGKPCHKPQRVGDCTEIGIETECHRTENSLGGHGTESTGN